MNEPGKVLLIIGPGGSGKSTLAEYISDKLGWSLVEEDRYWVKNGWGSGMRTEEQETAVQTEVSQDIIELCKSGKNVVVEFILYKNPPNPLTNYMENLKKAGVECVVMALKPSLEEILKRQYKRGRSSDIENIEEKREHAKHQIQCLEEDYIDDEWIVESTSLSVEDTFNLILPKLR